MQFMAAQQDLYVVLEVAQESFENKKARTFNGPGFFWNLFAITSHAVYDAAAARAVIAKPFVLAFSFTDHFVLF